MPICLVLMPFREELDGHFELIRQCGGQLGLDVQRVDTYTYSGHILQAIAKALAQADLIVADLTDVSPNVIYELAIAHCLGKKVLLVSNDLDTIPFDVASYRVELINLSSPSQPEKLCRAMKGVLDSLYVTGPLGSTVIYGQSLFFRRVAAFCIDAVAFVLVPCLVFLWDRSEGSQPLDATIWSAFAFCFYGAATIRLLGGTVGQRLLGLKVVTMEGERPSFWRALGRMALSLPLVAFTYGAGLLWCLKPPGYRTLHDLATQTMVVRR